MLGRVYIPGIIGVWLGYGREGGVDRESSCFWARVLVGGGESTRGHISLCFLSGLGCNSAGNVLGCSTASFTEFLPVTLVLSLVR